MTDSFRDIIRQVKENTDIVEVVGRVVVLKKAGNSFKGPCPFHQEKTPSFHVIPGKQIFHCFGCGVGGSVIDFVMKSERLEFFEALEKLAKDMGLEIPRSKPEDRGAREAEQKLSLDIQSANGEALAWFRENLLERRNPIASDYLPERGLTDDLSDLFQLGAAIDEWEGLKKHLMRLGFSENLLVDGGLCVRTENGRVYDRFRNRLIFPIFDVNGRVCGFGGRQLVKDERSPKYLNSAETVLYKKSNMLYALNLAKKDIEKTGYAILCEGYMDVIMAHAHGHTQAVASLGTALTPQQSKLLKRFANRTYFFYDGDSAGQKAMLRGGDSLLEAGFDTRVLSLPADDDPDTFLRREGADALHARFENAEEFFDFAMRSHAATLNVSTLAGQAELAERMAPIILSMKNDVMREAGIARLLRKLGGLPREALNRILLRFQRGEKRQQDPPSYANGASSPEPHPVPTRGYDPLETNLLKLMLESPEALAYIRPRLRHEWIVDSRLEGWIFYLANSESYVQTLLDTTEATGEFPAAREVIPAILALDMPERAKNKEAAQELLFRIHERHQQALTAELLSMLDQHLLSEEDATRMLKAYHNEHRIRIQNASGHLRSKDSRSRRKRV